MTRRHGTFTERPTLLAAALLPLLLNSAVTRAAQP
jgi:hypothetical protein